MAGKGGRTPGAGRKAGSGNLTRLTVRLSRAREDMAKCLSDPDLLNPLQRLFEYQTDPNPEIAYNATALLARLTIPMPAPVEERVHMDLPVMDTPAEIAEALSSIAAAVAAGALPVKQADALAKIISLKLDATSQQRLGERLEAVEDKLQTHNAPALLPQVDRMRQVA